MPTVGPSEPSGVTAGLLSRPWHLAPLPLPHFHLTRSYLIVLKAPLPRILPRQPPFAKAGEAPPLAPGAPIIGARHLLWVTASLP